jgi:hypothetical protein
MAGAAMAAGSEFVAAPAKVASIKLANVAIRMFFMEILPGR